MAPGVPQSGVAVRPVFHNPSTTALCFQPGLPQFPASCSTTHKQCVWCRCVYVCVSVHCVSVCLCEHVRGNVVAEPFLPIHPILCVFVCCACILMGSQVAKSDSVTD